ncbi:type VII secretion protein EccCa [Nocardia macrotermitis]|uniref:ESX secretion system protein EccC n=1 Tax=Nocardia macrotermitis TaxID=2585198 RepID=A0A7K0D9R8_9NOCA|nr:type VII secretion protein EccCa [Nocardia macrotermitis]MQY22467.1 ESX secretion system protein EccC [Nocardia macrotermitis]
MSTQGFVRMARIAPPRSPGGEVIIDAPPEITAPIPGPLWQRLMPLVMVVAMVGMMGLMFTMSGKSMLTNPMSMMFPMMMLMSMVGMFAGRGGGGGKKAAELNEERKDYFRYLEQLRRDVRNTGKAQRSALTWTHPHPKDLHSLIGTRRMWERRPNDPDFGHVRIGVGSHRIATKLARPETGPLEDLEPVATVALRRFVRTHSVVHRLPTAISLRAFPAVNIEGPREPTRDLARAMLMELAVFHGPDHLAIAIVTAEPDGAAWEWTKWLPHLQHPRAKDAIGSSRMLYESLAELEDSLSEDLLERGRFLRNTPPTAGRIHLVVLIDDGYVGGSERIVSDAGLDSVTVLDLTAPQTGLAARRGLQLVVEEGVIGARTGGTVEKFAGPDRVSIAESSTFARGMSRYRTATASQIVDLDADTVTDPGLMSLLKIPDAAKIEADTVWRPRSSRERLRVPIGVTPDGQPVEIDIKEAAENGMGPHGLCIGATGSGKSEFLRTLVLSMVTTHSPDLLNLVLVDFKGGATFLGLDPLPHVAAVITNLEDEISMVDRMRDALAGEMTRRQELLRAAGNFANVTEYEKARANGAALDPLPALFVIVDEFTELLSQKPDFAELFVMIGRLGRSLRVHLLLASQRLEENRLRGLDSHLSYRIGLRTFSASESRQVLGITDAYHLPSQPGSGYLKSDAADPLRFNASYVSGPYVAPVATVQRTVGVTAAPEVVDLFTATSIAVREAPKQPVQVELPDLNELLAEPIDAGPERSLLQVVVDRLVGHGRPAHEVWLPPLDISPTVDSLLPEQDWRSAANPVADLRMAIGIVDKPYEQRRDQLVIDLSGAQGHVAVVGGPQSGKSTALRTIIMAAAARHTPEQVQFYCVDFGGGTLAALGGLPHVGSAASRLEGDRVRRTIAELVTLQRQREARFLELGIENMREFRRRKAELAARPEAERAADPLSEDLFGDVFLVIDGWAGFREEFAPLEELVLPLTARGMSYGIHVMLAVNRWAEIRPAVRDQIGTRIELRLGDPTDSEMNRRAAGSVPENRPGRGMTRESLHMLLALPRLDSIPDANTLSDGVAAAKTALSELYPGRQAPPVRMLPLEIDRQQTVAATRALGITLDAKHVLIGLGESELQPLVLDFEEQPHLMAFADVGSGKTTLLRNIAMGIVENSHPDEARIILLDYRRTMLGVVEGPHLAGYSTSSQTSGGMIKEVAGFVSERIPGSDITPAQLRDRSWWSGPEVYVIVDDYDMVATSNPLTPLLELIPQARDIGLHLIIARRAGGASRALYDPVLGPMKDMSVDALLMSTPKDEGVILGDVRPAKYPPGRGVLVSRTRDRELIQICHLPPV